MSNIRIPRRVEINGQWYDVREGWAGTFELSAWGSPVKYTAKEPYNHIDNLYWVYDSSGNKVGEFHTTNGSRDGCVTGFQ